MRFDLDVGQHQLTWPELLERVRLAERSGFEGAWVFDHFKALYGDPSGPCMEGWTLLAALAAATERIRLGALVTGVTYRHPSILAAEAVTVDHVSSGRLEIGMGAAWFEDEHRELGVAFPPPRERIERLDEAITVMRSLMTADDVTFEGKHYTLTRARYRPRPVQSPHPPFWVGGSGRRLTLPVVGRQADAWHSFLGVEPMLEGWDIVRRAAESAGRDPESIALSNSLSLSQPWDAVRRDIDRAADAGVDVLIVGWPTEGRAHLERFVTDVLPAHRS